MGDMIATIFSGWLLYEEVKGLCVLALTCRGCQHQSSLVLVTEEPSPVEATPFQQFSCAGTPHMHHTSQASLSTPSQQQEGRGQRDEGGRGPTHCVPQGVVYPEEETRHTVKTCDTYIPKSQSDFVIGSK